MRQIEPDRKEFAKYVRDNVSKPKNWSKEFKDFPPSSTMLRKYFCHIYKEDKYLEKIVLIRKYWNLAHSFSKTEAIEMLESSNKTKTIENFFKHKTTPEIETLDFIAAFFDCPIANYDEFIVKQDQKEQNKYISWSKIEGIQYKLKQHDWAISGLIITSLILLLSMLYVLPSHLFQKETIHTQSELIEKMSFQPIIVPSDSIVVGRSKSAESPKFGNDTTLVFHTNNIYNTNYIIPQNNWSFPTDPQGEDIRSEYGAPYNHMIRGTEEVKDDKISIANRKMKIRFNVFNGSHENWVIDNLFIEILEVYDIDPHQTKKAVWSKKSLPQKSYKIELIAQNRIYPLEVFEELAKSESAYFALDILAQDVLMKNKVVRFNITLRANDGQGNKIELHSDKDYLIANVRTMD